MAGPPEIYADGHIAFASRLAPTLDRMNRYNPCSPKEPACPT